MSEQQTDRSVIEGIDLDAVVPCSHSQHGTHHVPEQPAAYIVEFWHECGLRVRYCCCESGWDMMVTTMCPTWIGGCGEEHLPRDAVLYIDEVLT